MAILLFSCSAGFFVSALCVTDFEYACLTGTLGTASFFSTLAISCPFIGFDPLAGIPRTSTLAFAFPFAGLEPSVVRGDCFGTSFACCFEVLSAGDISGVMSVDEVRLVLDMISCCGSDELRKAGIIEAHQLKPLAIDAVQEDSTFWEEDGISEGVGLDDFSSIYSQAFSLTVVVDPMLSSCTVAVGPGVMIGSPLEPDACKGAGVEGDILLRLRRFGRFC